MIDPGTAMLIATAVSSAAKGITAMKGKKGEKRKLKHEKEKTHGEFLENTLKRESQQEAQNRLRKSHSGKRSAQSMLDTADIIRGAINI